MSQDHKTTEPLSLNHVSQHPADPTHTSLNKTLLYNSAAKGNIILRNPSNFAIFMVTWWKPHPAHCYAPCCVLCPEYVATMWLVVTMGCHSQKTVELKTFALWGFDLFDDENRLTFDMQNQLHSREFVSISVLCFFRTLTVLRCSTHFWRSMSHKNQQTSDLMSSRSKVPAQSSNLTIDSTPMTSWSQHPEPLWLQVTFVTTFR